MKRIVFLSFLIFLLFETSTVIAECASRYTWVWPKSSNIPINTLFILEGYGTNQKIIESLHSKTIYLLSNNDKVFLVPKKKYKGQMNISQVILEPEYPLIVGEKYKIYAPPMKDGALHSYTREGPFYFEWTVTQEEDIRAPMFTTTPQVKDKHYIMYGFGPEVMVDVSIEATDENFIFAEVELETVKEKGEIIASYLLPVLEGKIKIGHGMCSGAFNLISGVKYEATITLFDASGNQASDSIRKIQFEGPAP